MTTNNPPEPNGYTLDPVTVATLCQLARLEGVSFQEAAVRAYNAFYAHLAVGGQPPTVAEQEACEAYVIHRAALHCLSRGGDRHGA